MTFITSFNKFEQQKWVIHSMILIELLYFESMYLQLVTFVCNLVVEDFYLSDNNSVFYKKEKIINLWLDICRN